MGKRQVFGIFFITLMFFMLGVVSAATLNVENNASCSDVSGNPYCTIQAAIDNSSVGDVVNVSGGPYAESVDMTEEVEVIGNGVAVNPAAGNYAFKITADNTKVRDFAITTSGAIVGGAIMIENADNVDILTNTITTSTDGFLGIWVCGSASGCDGTQNLDIKHNIITINNKATGIYADNSNPAHFNWLIENNTITASDRGVDLELYDVNQAVVKNNTFGISGSVSFVYSSEESNVSNLNLIDNVFLGNGDLNGWGVTPTIWIESDFNTWDGNTKVNDVSIQGNDFNNWINAGIKIGEPGGSGIYNYVTNVVVNYNSFYSGTGPAIDNYVDEEIFDGTNNWWGVCDGPGPVGPGSGAGVSVNVTFSPWLGACINEKVENKGCYFVGESVILYANVSSLSCIGSVWFGIDMGSGWQNYTGSASTSGIGNYSYTINSANFSGGESVDWTVYSDDCNNHTTQDGTRTFYINRRTNVSVSPIAPNGLAGWYATEPIFTLTNPDLAGGSIWYRWDGSAELIYAAPFGLENIPNSPRPESAGTLNLKYWSTICASVLDANESMQNQTFKIDMIAPQFNTFLPLDGSNTFNNQRPTISVYIDEVYGTNSGIKLSSVALAIDGVNVSESVSAADSLDATATYTPLSDLALGWHTATIYAEDNAGHSNSTNWIFNLTLESMFTSLNITSPENNQYYAGRAVPINVALDGTADLRYIDYFESYPRWKTLCYDCTGYSDTKSFSDGDFNEVLGMADSWHNITIKATDVNGNTMEESRYFFVDGKLPRVSKMLPSRGKVVNGSYFFIKYHEDNLRNITLRYGNLLLGYGEKNLTNCPAGRNKNCSTSLNLAGYENQSIEYWYDVADVVHTISSRIVSIRVDTISPVMTIYAPNDASYGRYVYFNITINENVKKLEYYDQSEAYPRWRRLCSNCNSYGFSRVGKKSFYEGVHNIIIRASDYAGNTDEETRVFSVAY